MSSMIVATSTKLVNFSVYLKMFNWHKKQLEWWKKTFGISNSVIVWIAFFKGVVIGLLIYHFLVR